MRRVALLVAGAVAAPAEPSASAEAPGVTPVQPVEAPAPLTLPELVARNRWSFSAGAIGALDTRGIAVDGGITYARGDLELFGGATLFGFVGGDCYEGCLAGVTHQLAFGNTRLGARYIFAVGSISIAPATWVWLPTAAAERSWWPRARAVMMSANDSRTFLIDAAIGTAVDVAWRGERQFVQAELGTAFVDDQGPQLDNVFGTLAAGTRVSTKTSLLAEWRVDAYPRETLIHAVGAGISRGDGDRRMWRARVHVIRAGTVGPQQLGVNGLTLDFDLVQRW